MQQPDLLSRSAIDRRNAVRRLVRRLQDRAGVSSTHLARATGHSRQRWARLMSEDESSCLQLADVLVLEEELGGLLLALAESAGYTLIRDEPRPASTRDVLDATCTLMADTARGVSAATEALSDGVITPSEAQGVELILEEARASLDTLRAKVRASTVEPLHVARGRR